MEGVRSFRVEVQRTARVLTLGEPARADEVWILLHGYGQLASAMLEGCAALASARRFLVAPEALSRSYLRGGTGAVGASWMTREERDAEIADQIRYLDEVAGWISAERQCPARARVVLGFSQGAQVAWRWAALGATPLGRVIGWGSDLPPDLDLDSVPKLRAMRTTLVHGSRDAAQTSATVARDVERASRAGIELEVVEFDGAHALDAEVLVRLAGAP